MGDSGDARLLGTFSVDEDTLARTLSAFGLVALRQVGNPDLPPPPDDEGLPYYLVQAGILVRYLLLRRHGGTLTALIAALRRIAERAASGVTSEA